MRVINHGSSIDCKVMVFEKDSTKYVVSVAKSKLPTYMISIPNFFISLNTTNLASVPNKLMELGLSMRDAANVYEAVLYLDSTMVNLLELGTEKIRAIG